MAKKFDGLREGIPPQARQRAAAKTEAMLRELPLAQLRQARHFSRQQLADALEIQQPAVAKMEKKADMYISTMRRFIEAMGGSLEIRAHFPDGDVSIRLFEELEDTRPAGSQPAKGRGDQVTPR